MGVLRAPLLLNEPSAQVIKGSLKIKSGSYLSRTFGTGSDADVWTFSCWIKRATLGTTQYIFRTPSVDEGFYFSTSNKIDIYRYSGSFTYFGSSPSVLRDCAGWQHIVYAHDSNAASGDRLRLYINGVLQKLTSLTDIGSGSNYSLNSAVAHRIGEIDGYMSQCYFVDGLSLGPGYFGFSDPLTGTWRPQKFKAEGTTVNDGRVFSSTGTFSNWDDDGNYPKTELFDGTLYTGGTPNGASSDSSSEATFDFGNQRIKGFQNLKINIFLSSNQVAAKDVVSVNGIDITNECHKAGNNVWVTVDLGSKFKSLQSFRIANNSIYVGGFIIDGVVVKDSTTQNLSFGTNGFYLPMDNQDDFEKDKSGNANDFTKNSFSGTSIDPDIVKDSPSGAVTGGRAQTGITTTSSAPTNYCTWNPLSGQYIDLQDGNLDAESGTISSYATIPSTMAMTNGKYYAEFTYRENIDGDGDGSNFFRFGISQTDRNFESGSDPFGTSKDFGFQGAGTLKARTNGSASYTYTGNTIADGDILSLAFDADAGKLWVARNGTWATNSGGAGDPVNGNNPDYSSLNYSGGYFFVAGPYAGAQSPANGGGRLSAGLVGNWGQKPFKYAPPKGFLPLNSATARPNKVITRPDQYVGVTTYAGNTSSVVVKDLSFKPDLVWVKGFTDADRHGLYDTVRGVTKRLQSPYTNAEDTQNGVTSFNDNGFSIGNYGDSNGNARGYVAWAWKAGGNKNTFNVDDVGYASAGDIDMGVGDLNSVSYNKSQTWTSQISGTQNSSYPFANMFNADNEATHAYPANGTTATFTPSPSFSNAKTVKVWYYAPTINSNTFKLNGVNVGDQMTETSGTLTKTFKVNGFTSWSWSKGVGGDDSGMLRIDVDDVQLVDNGVSTSDVPSIAPSGCSVGTKQGFSIIKFASGSSGTKTLPHGLSENLDFILLKTTGTTSDWSVYHKDLGATDKYLVLNTTAANASASNIWGAGAFPFQTSRVFGIKSGTTCAASQDVIAYCWHDVPGLQKFGTYEGLGGSANGSFVELGFRPAIVWVKNIDTASQSNTHWCIFDNLRPGFNKSPAQNRLHADADSQQDPDRVDEGQGIDILSNGFRVRSNNWYETNLSGATYIYCAWAEAPAFNLFGGQSNAR